MALCVDYIAYSQNDLVLTKVFTDYASNELTASCPLSNRQLFTPATNSDNAPHLQSPDASKPRILLWVLPIVPNKMDDDEISLNPIEQAGIAVDSPTADCFETGALAAFREFFEEFELVVKFVQKPIYRSLREMFK